jgi:5-methylcytosine-specific restriction endonuclease McrBC regulatory subunit McrC
VARRSYELEGLKYVGRALVGDSEIEVREKIPGAVAALADFVTGSELKLEKVASPATPLDALSRLLMLEFTAQVGTYIADRRKARFVYRHKVSPVLAGRLDMPATMRLHASGGLGKFAFQQGTVTRDEPLDRVVLAALDELDRISAAVGLPSETVHTARWLGAALDEVRDSQFIGSTVPGFLSSVDGIEGNPESLSADRDLARLAAAVLMHHGVAGQAGVGEVPRALFIDVETLFEQAVRRALRCVLADFAVDKGESFDRQLFQDGSDSSKTHPDLVVHRDGIVLAVGDVKYKSLAGPDHEPGKLKKESRSDLYQVLVHAAALDASRAFLIYPGDNATSVRYLGLSGTGSHTWSSSVRPIHIMDDLADLAEALALF